MDTTAFQGMFPNGQPSGGLLSQQSQPTGLMGPWSQVAYQMAGSPKQGGAYAPVAAPPSVGGSGGLSAGGAAGSAAGGVLTGLLGAVAKNPQLLKNVGSLFGGGSAWNTAQQGLSSSGLLPSGALGGSLSGGLVPVGLGAAQDAATSSANEAAQALAGYSPGAAGSTADALSGYPVVPNGSGLLGRAATLFPDDLAATTGIAGAGLQSVGLGAAQDAATSSAAEAAQALNGSAGGGIFGTGFSGSQALGAAAIPLALYNEINNWQSGATGSDALAGAGTGAAIGSVVPVIGTALGALIGGAGGALSSLFGPGKKDPETGVVQNLINAVSSHPGQASAITSQVQNPYVNLAGLFDARSSTLPMYQQYGRMGEAKFTQDLAGQLNSALSSGKISQATSPTDAYNQVIAPWVASMGKGWGAVGPEYTATAQGLLQQMTAQYMNGSWAQNWKPIGGQAVSSWAGNIPLFGSSQTLGQSVKATPAAAPVSLANQRLAQMRGLLR